MAILGREQIDATYPGPLRDTALAYHDLRDAVLALCINGGVRLNGEERLFAESDLRSVVARVERGES